LDFLKHFEAIDINMDGSFPNEPLHVTFGLTVEKLWCFEDFSPSSSMLSATVNAGKFAQICPKSAKICPKMKL
jgi:hypothetical protein